MFDEIRHLEQEISETASAIVDEAGVERYRISFLARKGAIAKLFDRLSTVAAPEKPAMGKALNALRVRARELLEEAERRIATDAHAAAPPVDVTLPGRRIPRGHEHIVMQTIVEIREIFLSMGFHVAVGPEIETDFYNFEALNFPPDHPARDMQDTFFLSDGVLLRTHTTPVQVRVMEREHPPVRIIMPGRVFRNEAISARSHVQFHQVDGLYVDEHVTFADLKGTLVRFAREYYGASLQFRFRPSFFPFTEPSAEMDIQCYLCGGSGCRVCKKSGWLEILGCGMVDPNVFRAVGYDAERYSGYAFGIGIERTAMLRHGIDDIRLLFDNDLRVNHQFG